MGHGAGREGTGRGARGREGDGWGGGAWRKPHLVSQRLRNAHAVNLAAAAATPTPTFAAAAATAAAFAATSTTAAVWPRWRVGLPLEPQVSIEVRQLPVVLHRRRDHIESVERSPVPRVLSGRRANGTVYVHVLLLVLGVGQPHAAKVLAAARVGIVLGLGCLKALAVLLQERLGQPLPLLEVYAHAVIAAAFAAAEAELLVVLTGDELAVADPVQLALRRLHYGRRLLLLLGLFLLLGFVLGLVSRHVHHASEPNRRLSRPTVGRS